MINIICSIAWSVLIARIAYEYSFIYEANERYTLIDKLAASVCDLTSVIEVIHYATFDRYVICATHYHNVGTLPKLFMSMHSGVAEIEYDFDHCYLDVASCNDIDTVCPFNLNCIAFIASSNQPISLSFVQHIHVQTSQQSIITSLIKLTRDRCFNTIIYTMDSHSSIHEWLLSNLNSRMTLIWKSSCKFVASQSMPAIIMLVQTNNFVITEYTLAIMAQAGVYVLLIGSQSNLAFDVRLVESAIDKRFVLHKYGIQTSGILMV